MPAPTRMSHEQCRSQTCFVCRRKALDHPINEKGKELVRENLVKDVPWDHPCIPSGLCPTCFRHLANGQLADLPPLADFRETVIFPPQTRAVAAGHCTCLICRVHYPGGPGKVSPLTAPNLKLSKGGRPKKARTDAERLVEFQSTPPQEILTTMCRRCCLIGATVDDGHECSKAARARNLFEMTQQIPDVGERVASKILKSKTGSPKGTKYLHQEAGRKVPFAPGRTPDPKPDPKVSLAAMQGYQKTQHVSTRGMKQLRTILNKDAGKRITAPNMEQFLKEISQQLKGHFVKSVVLIQGHEFTVYHVKDLHEFINAAAQLRDIDRSKCLARLNMDDGQGSLKISLNLIDLTSERYNAGAVAKERKETGKFLDSGVEKLNLVCHAPDLKESHDSVKACFELIKVRESVKAAEQFGAGEFYLCPDFKIDNFVCGIGGHSSLFPCCWCIKHKNSLEELGVARTFGRIRAQNTARTNSNGQAKKYESCVADPPLGEDDQEVIQLIVPGELHILLGVVITLITDIENGGLLSNIDEWFECLGIKKSPYHGGTFPGNTCKTLISKKGVDILEEVALRQDLLEEIKPYAKVFRCMDRVSSKVFGNILDPTWKDEIEEFGRLFNALSRSWTPKVHALVHHVPQFILAGEKPRALGAYSEQAAESIHHRYKEFYSKRFSKLPRKHAEDPQLHALVVFNSENV